MRPIPVFVLSTTLLLSGCEWLGLDAPEKLAAVKEADGKAIGSACRHAGRAIEDCYLLNPKAQRAAVFAGWREMDEYMRENKVEAVPPQLAHPPEPAGATAEVAATAEPPAEAAKGSKPASPNS